MSTVKARYDGHVFIPEGPVNLPVGHVLEIVLNQPSADLASRFNRLAEEWHQATAHHSSSRLRYEHPSYQAIVALGAQVIPLLLRDLETKRRHWFAALQAITGVNPVAAQDAGHIDRMIEAWLRWGRQMSLR